METFITTWIWKTKVYSVDVCVCVCVRVCGVGGGERDLLPLMYEKLRFITSDFLYNLVLEMEYPNWRQRIFGLSYHKGERRESSDPDNFCRTRLSEGRENGGII